VAGKGIAGRATSKIRVVAPLLEPVSVRLPQSAASRVLRRNIAWVGLVAVDTNVDVELWVSPENDRNNLGIIFGRERRHSEVLRSSIRANGEGGAGDDIAHDDRSLAIPHDDDLGRWASVEVALNLTSAVLDANGHGAVADRGGIIHDDRIRVRDGGQDGIDVNALDAETIGRHFAGSARGENVHAAVAGCGLGDGSGSEEARCQHKWQSHGTSGGHLG